MGRAWLCLLLSLLVLACGGADSLPPPASSTGPIFPAPPAAWGAWIQAHHHPIRSLDLAAPEDQDLDFLKDLVGDRRFVLLGESTHGCADFNALKGRLIRYLHERMGFNVLAFESGVYEGFVANEQAATRSAKQTMHAAIYGSWYCAETLALFEYLKASKATPNPLILAGLDCQSNTSESRNSAPDEVAALVARVDPAYAESVKALLAECRPKVYGEAGRQLLLPKKERLQRDLLAFEAWMATHLGELQAAVPTRPLWPRVVHLEARATWAYLNEVTLVPGPAMQAARDSFMAHAARQLLEFHPGQKVIIWAHDGHVGMEPTLGPSGELLCKNLGGYLKETHERDMYCLGLTLLSGEQRFNDGKVGRVPLPPSESLEAILAATGASQGCVDFLHQVPGPGTSWMFQPLNRFDWGTYPRKDILSELFHGVLFVRQGKPIQYLF